MDYLLEHTVAAVSHPSPHGLRCSPPVPVPSCIHVLRSIAVPKDRSTECAFTVFSPFPWTFFHSSSWRIDAEPDDVIIRRGGFLQAVRWLSVSSICRMHLVTRSSAQVNRAGRQKQERWESLFCMNRFSFFLIRFLSV
jgi:hypothetical protein